MFIIKEGSSPDESAVFEILQGPLENPGIRGQWFHVRRLSDGKEFFVGADTPTVEAIAARFVGSCAVRIN